MSGIILAGGTGTRLHPITLGRQQAAGAGLRQADDLLPADHADAGRHPRHPGDHDPARRAGSSSGCSGTGRSSALNLSYAQQPSPDGLAQAFMIGADFIGDDTVALVLGRQPLLRPGLRPRAARASQNVDGAAVFAYQVSDPSRVRRRRVRPTADGAVAGGEADAPAQQLRDPGALLLRQRRRRRSPATSSRRRAASTRSPTSTAPTSSRAGSASRCSTAGSPGSTPAPSTRSTTPATSSRPSSTGRASRSAAPRRSPGEQGFLSDDELRQRGETLAKSGYGEYLLSLLRTG